MDEYEMKIKPNGQPELELFDIKYEPVYALEELTNHARVFYDTHNHHELSNDFNIFMHAKPKSDNDPIILVNPNTVIPKISSSNSAAAAAAATSSGAATNAAVPAVTATTTAISNTQKTDMAKSIITYALNNESMPVESNRYFSQINASTSSNGQSGYCGDGNVETRDYSQDLVDKHVSEFVAENDIDLEKLFESSSLVPMMEAETSTVRMVPTQDVTVTNNDGISEVYEPTAPRIQHNPSIVKGRNPTNWNAGQYGIKDFQRNDFSGITQLYGSESYSKFPAATCLSSSSVSSISSISPASTSSSLSSLSSSGNDYKHKRRRYDLSNSMSVVELRTPASLTKAHSTKEVACISSHPKPAYSYSCLITLALKNSPTGRLRVSEIYNFLCKHFPYFKTAPNGWKNSVRHNLSLNKCFEKIEKTTNGSQAKGCYWTINTEKVKKMEEEMLKWSRKDPVAIRKALQNPEDMEALENGDFKYNMIVSGNGSSPSEDGEFDLTDDIYDEFLDVTTAITTAPHSTTAKKTSNATPMRVVNNAMPIYVKRQKSSSNGDDNLPNSI